MFKNVAGQRIEIYAYDSSANAGKSGDASNITARLSKNGGVSVATNDVNPTELDAVNMPGLYAFDMTQAETSTDLLVLYPSSTTTNVKIDPVVIYTVAFTGPNSPISAYLDAFEQFYLNSSNFLSWIQSVNMTGTTSGHVFLHYFPQNLPDVVTFGPIAIIRWDNFLAENAGSPNNFVTGIDIVVDHVFALGANTRSSEKFIPEMNFISDILDELTATIGISLTTGFGGNLMRISSLNALTQDLEKPNIWHIEVRNHITFGLKRA